MKKEEIEKIIVLLESSAITMNELLVILKEESRDYGWHYQYRQACCSLPKNETLPKKAESVVRSISFGEGIGLEGDFLRVNVEQKISPEEWRKGNREGGVLSHSTFNVYGTSQCGWCGKKHEDGHSPWDECLYCGGS